MIYFMFKQPHLKVRHRKKNLVRPPTAKFTNPAKGKKYLNEKLSLKLIRLKLLERYSKRPANGYNYLFKEWIKY